MSFASAETLDSLMSKLQHAAREGSLDKVKQLLREGANIHEKDTSGLSYQVVLM
jgi:ankyrin repeat protein